MTALDSGPELVRVPVDGPAEAAFTTRAGGVSTGAHRSCNLALGTGDREANVAENRRRVGAALGLSLDRVSMGTQVHGVRIREVRGAGDPQFDDVATERPEGDGLLTRDPDRALVVVVADCVPVLLWRRDRPGVSALHCGWRGVAGGLVARGVAALGDPAATGMAIGPGIGPCCFEVGPEVRDRFARHFGDEVVHGRTLDLVGAIRRDARRAGVAEAAIWALAACTKCEGDRWFSYRRDGARTGRQAGIVRAA
ncbi:MAG: polyphenol oxidase family protein [Thermoleophilia bacterium]